VSGESPGGAPARFGSLLRVGLTGGIACGKSRVLRTLAASGCSTLDLDDVSRSVMAPGGAAYAPVVEAFGSELLDAEGAIDRRRLGERVFGDAEARARLEEIVHPEIRREESRWVERSVTASPGGVFVSDGALLVETGLLLRYDRLVVVHTTPENQVARLMARDGLSGDAARARVAAQMPVAEKARFAHHRIESSGALEETDAQAAAVASRLLEEASQPAATAKLPSDRIAVCEETVSSREIAAALVDELAAGRALDLRRLSGRVRAVPPRDWFAGEPVAGAGAALGPLLAAWSLGLRGDDDAFLSGAAYAVGRALGLDSVAIADLCLAALAAARIALGEPDLADAFRGLQSRARDWSGVAPSGLVEQALQDARAGAPGDELAAAFRTLLSLEL